MLSLHSDLSHYVESAFKLVPLRCLQKNQTLMTLDISWNGFSLSGCKELGRALRKNTTLTDLNLSANRVTSDALLTLLDGLQYNQGLIKLTVFVMLINQ